MFPQTEVHRGIRWVDEGDLVTSAGIDMSLHLVERLLGCEMAEETAKRMAGRKTSMSILILSANCFGNHLSRTGIDLSTSELLNFKHAGRVYRARPVCKGTANPHGGNSLTEFRSAFTRLCEELHCSGNENSAPAQLASI